MGEVCILLWMTMSPRFPERMREKKIINQNEFPSKEPEGAAAATNWFAYEAPGEFLPHLRVKMMVRRSTGSPCPGRWSLLLLSCLCGKQLFSFVELWSEFAGRREA